MKDFPTRLRSWMARNGLTKKEAGAILGAHRHSIRRWCAGDPPAESRARAAIFLMDAHDRDSRSGAAA